MITKDLSLIEELFKTHYKSLINYACKYVFNKSVADDVIQDVFMSVWINRENIDFETKYIKSYLFKAVRSRCLNYIQSVKDSLSLNIDDVSFIIQKEIFSGRAYDNLLLEDLEREIANSIDSLPPQCKKIFIHSRVDHLKNKEIAGMLGISEKAVEKQITKALSEIRKHLIKVNLLSALFFLYYTI